MTKKNQEGKALPYFTLIQKLLSLIGEDQKPRLEALKAEVSTSVRQLLTKRIRELQICRLREYAESCNMRGDIR